LGKDIAFISQMCINKSSLARSRFTMTILDDPQRGQHGAAAEQCEADLKALPVSGDHAWLAALLRTAMDPVIISDSKLRIVLSNTEAQRLFGYRSNQLHGCSMALLLTAASCERLQQAAGGAASAARFRAEAVRADGSHFNMDLSLSSVTCGDEAFLVASMRDASLASVAGRRRALSFQHAHELEKRRFSRELYNELGQCLSVLKLDLDWLEQTLHKSDRASPDVRRISNMQAVLDNAIMRTRAIASDLRPPLLDDFGLLAAVRWITQAFEKRTGVRCEIDCVTDPIAGGDAVHSVVYRVVQECLLNVERHAHASRVQVSIRTDGRRLEVLVQDNGAGMPSGAERKPGCFGLVAMQERIYTLGGNMDISSSAAQGSAIYVSLPIEPPAIHLS
jgi:PAS domain S-box-containing protein